jgi:hypothetical protein
MATPDPAVDNRGDGIVAQIQVGKKPAEMSTEELCAQMDLLEEQIYAILGRPKR